MRKKVDDIIASGALGKVYYIQSGGGRRRGIPGGTFVDGTKAGFGCLGDIGCYSIDECLHAVKYPKPLTVSAIATDYFGKNPKYWPDADSFDVDDFSIALVRMEGDVTFVFKQSWAMHADSLGDRWDMEDAVAMVKIWRHWVGIEEPTADPNFDTGTLAQAGKGFDHTCSVSTQSHSAFEHYHDLSLALPADKLRKLT
jgi:predicted dehydrogenase